MFEIEWVHRAESLGREPVEGTDTSEIVHATRARAVEVSKRHPGEEPDSFRVMDSSGAEVGTFSVSERAFDGTT